MDFNNKTENLILRLFKEICKRYKNETLEECERLNSVIKEHIWFYLNLAMTGTRLKNLRDKNNNNK